MVPFEVSNALIIQKTIEDLAVFSDRGDMVIVQLPFILLPDFIFISFGLSVAFLVSDTFYVLFIFTHTHTINPCNP